MNSNFSSTPELFLRSEMDYLQFLQLYLQLQVSLLKTVLYSPSTPSEQTKTESQLIASLDLAEKIFMHLSIRDRLLPNQESIKTDDDMKEKQQEVEHVIIEFRSYVDAYSFVESVNKQQCKRLLKQISGYFFQDNVKVIIIDPTPPKPWKPI